MSYLQSEAAHYRIKDAEAKKWRQKEWVYTRIFLPCCTIAFFVIAYFIFFSKEYEPTEEQLQRLKSFLDSIEERKRIGDSSDSNKPNA